jgi:biopolymer transport protein ExbD
MAGGGGGESELSSAPNPLSAQAGALLPRRGAIGDSHFDVTPLVDLVFMMNIYFLVTSMTSLAADVDLPRATHVVPVDEEKSVTIVIVLGPDGKTPIVTLGQDDSKGKLTDPDEQVERVKVAVQKGVRENKLDVVLRAERGVKIRDVSRIAAAAGKVDGAKLYVAVLEVDRR